MAYTNPKARIGHFLYETHGCSCWSRPPKVSGLLPQANHLQDQAHTSMGCSLEIRPYGPPSSEGSQTCMVAGRLSLGMLAIRENRAICLTPLVRIPVSRGVGVLQSR